MRQWAIQVPINLPPGPMHLTPNSIGKYALRQEGDGKWFRYNIPLVDFKKKHKLRLLDLIVLLEKGDTTTDHRGWFIRAAKGDNASDEEDAPDQVPLHAAPAAAPTAATPTAPSAAPPAAPPATPAAAPPAAPPAAHPAQDSSSDSEVLVVLGCVVLCCAVLCCCTLFAPHVNEIAHVQDEFIVQAIKDDRRRKGQREYLVSWAGFDESHDTWEPADNLHPDAIAEYQQSDVLSEYERDRLDKIMSNQATTHAYTDAYCALSSHSLHTLCTLSAHSLYVCTWIYHHLVPLGIPQPVV